MVRLTLAPHTLWMLRKCSAWIHRYFRNLRPLMRTEVALKDVRNKIREPRKSENP